MIRFRENVLVESADGDSKTSAEWGAEERATEDLARRARYRRSHSPGEDVCMKAAGKRFAIKGPGDSGSGSRLHTSAILLAATDC